MQKSVVRVAMTMTILGGLALATAALAADWPGWLGPNRDGKSADTGLLKAWPAGGPKQVWKNDSVGAGWSSIAVVGDMVYTAGDVDGKQMLYGIDKEGKEKWKSEAGPACEAGGYKGSRSTPVVDGGLVYITGGAGFVGCFDATTGARKWEKDLTSFGGKAAAWGYAESVLILDKMAIVTPGGKNCVVALDKTTGEKIWSSEGFNGAAQYGSAIAVQQGGQTALCVGTGGGLAFFDAKTGKNLYSNPFAARNTANCPTPIYSDGYVFWANGYGKGGVCVKVDVKDGKWAFKEAWTTKDMDCHHGGYVVQDGYIYGNNGGGWACIELASGTTKWKDKGVGKGSICLADGMLYLFSEAGGRAGLAAASPEGLKLVGDFKVQGKAQSWAHPVVANGRLYLRYDTNLYCFDVSGK